MFKTQNGWTKAKMIEAITTLNQGFCGTGYGKCFYRHPDNSGNRCFMGVFIPDSQYMNEFEDISSCGLLNDTDRRGNKHNNFVPSLLAYMPLLPEGIEQLQGLHDRSDDLDKRKLHQLAIDWINKNVEDT